MIIQLYQKELTGYTEVISSNYPFYVSHIKKDTHTNIYTRDSSHPMVIQLEVSMPLRNCVLILSEAARKPLCASFRSRASRA